MIPIFQLALFSLVALSFILVIGVPVAFASPNGWTSTKGFIFPSLSLWVILVFAVGLLNSFVI
jgi:photosystem II PsbZ protein